MPKIDPNQVTERTRGVYPGPLSAITEGRGKRGLSDEAGLTQFGVNLTRLTPGAASAHRHWHENEDEFVYMLEGEVVLVEDAGETVLRPGDAAGFKAGVADGHHLVNRSGGDALFLEVGTRAATERAHYPDVDLAVTKGPDGWLFTKKNGEPY